MLTEVIQTVQEILKTVLGAIYSFGRVLFWNPFKVRVFLCRPLAMMLVIAGTLIAVMMVGIVMLCYSETPSIREQQP